MEITKGDALDRVVDYCPELTSLWRSAEDAPDEKEQEDIREQLRKAERYFLILLGEAEETGIGKSELRTIVLERLPTRLIKDLAERLG